MRNLAPMIMLLVLVGCIEPVQLEWKYDLGAPSVSTPLVTTSYIAVGTGQGVRLLSPRGTLRCSFDKAAEVISRPATDGELIFFGSTNYLVYAMDTHCKQQWSFQTRDRVKADPLVHNGTVYIGSYDGNLYALDAKTGAVKWTFPDTYTKKKNSSQFEMGSQSPAGISPESVAVAEGALKAKALREDVGAFSYSSASIHNGIIFVGNLDHRVYALNAETGDMLWRYKTEAPVTSTPVVNGTAVYFGSNDGNVYAVDIGDLEKPTVRWKMATRDWVNSSARVEDGVVFIGSNDRRLYALDAATGNGRWSYATKGPTISVPATYKSLVFVAGGAGDGTVYALDKKTGDLHWRFRTNEKIESDPVVSEADRRLYISSVDGHLYAFMINSTVPQR